MSDQDLIDPGSPYPCMDLLLDFLDNSNEDVFASQQPHPSNEIPTEMNLQVHGDNQGQVGKEEDIWKEPLAEEAAIKLDKNDPFRASLSDSSNKVDVFKGLKVIASKNHRMDKDCHEFKRDRAVTFEVDGHLSSFLILALVHTSPDKLKSTIVSMNDDGKAAFEAESLASPSDKMTSDFQTFIHPRYGKILVKVLALHGCPKFWVKFNTHSTHAVNGGNHAGNKVWNLIAWSMDPYQASKDDSGHLVFDFDTLTKIEKMKSMKMQVVAEIRRNKQLVHPRGSDPVDEVTETMAIIGKRHGNLSNERKRRIEKTLRAQEPENEENGQDNNILDLESLPPDKRKKIEEILKS